MQSAALVANVFQDLAVLIELGEEYLLIGGFSLLLRPAIKKITVSVVSAGIVMVTALVK